VIGVRVAVQPDFPLRVGEFLRARPGGVSHSALASQCNRTRAFFAYMICTDSNTVQRSFAHDPSNAPCRHQCSGTFFHGSERLFFSRSVPIRSARCAQLVEAPCFFCSFFSQPDNESRQQARLQSARTPWRCVLARFLLRTLSFVQLQLLTLCHFFISRKTASKHALQSTPRSLFVWVTIGRELNGRAIWSRLDADAIVTFVHELLMPESWTFASSPEESESQGRTATESSSNAKVITLALGRSTSCALHSNFLKRPKHSCDLSMVSCFC